MDTSTRLTQKALRSPFRRLSKSPLRYSSLRFSFRFFPSSWERGSPAVTPSTGWLVSLPWLVVLQEVKRSPSSPLRPALSTVHRSARIGFKWNRTFLAAVGANCPVHPPCPSKRSSSSIRQFSPLFALCPLLIPSFSHSTYLLAGRFFLRDPFILVALSIFPRFSNWLACFKNCS